MENLYEIANVDQKHLAVSPVGRAVKLVAKATRGLLVKDVHLEDKSVQIIMLTTMQVSAKNFAQTKEKGLAMYIFICNDQDFAMSDNPLYTDFPLLEV